jgi:hypothetical protein
MITRIGQGSARYPSIQAVIKISDTLNIRIDEVIRKTRFLPIGKRVDNHTTCGAAAISQRDIYG